MFSSSSSCSSPPPPASKEEPQRITISIDEARRRFAWSMRALELAVTDELHIVIGPAPLEMAANLILSGLPPGCRNNTAAVVADKEEEANNNIVVDQEWFDRCFWSTAGGVILNWLQDSAGRGPLSPERSARARDAWQAHRRALGDPTLFPPWSPW